MQGNWISVKRYAVLIYLLLFLVLGIYLYSYTSASKPYAEEQLIWDLIWLDAWAISCLLAVLIVWNTIKTCKWKYVIAISCISLYGIIYTRLLFDGTPYGINAYWGDQKFRIAMILKFMSFNLPTDFYYKGLAPFYPPLYYYLLSVFSRLFSLEAYKMLKIGSMLTYLIGPPLLYYFWRRIVSPFQAFFITVSSFLFCSYGRPFQFLSPPAFAANLFFIPWWLYYIERVKNPQSNRKYYLSGGLIGAAIFMTYFYPFLIGGLLLLLRVTVFRGWQFVKKAQYFKLNKAIGVLIWAAIFSAPYWLPTLIAALTTRLDSSPAGWHHVGTPGLTFQFLEFSITGLAFLAAILYLARRSFVPLNRGLLLIIGASVMFHLLASLLGALGRPLNVAKAMHFTEMAAGACVGLLLAGVVRWSGISRKYRMVTAALVMALFIIVLNNFNGLIKHSWVKVSRQSGVPSWNTDAKEMAGRKGTVFLTGHEELCSFYPVYTFIAANEHYSHPASRFKVRYDFLYTLQEIKDPYLFYLVLRHNIFDPIDFFMPRDREGQFEILVSLSNYPNRLYSKRLRLSHSVVQDESLFARERGDHLYRLQTSLPAMNGREFDFRVGSAADSLLFLARIKWLRGNLDSAGIVLLDNYCRADWSSWSDIEIPGGKHNFGRKITFNDGSIVTVGDSTYFLLLFSSRDDLAADYKVFLHLYDAQGNFRNFDFMPLTKTSSWKKWDLVICGRAIPRIEGEFKYSFGFFKGSKRLEEDFEGHYPTGSLNLSAE